MSKGQEYSVVVGLGATGLSCVAHLVSRGQHVVVVDSRLTPPGLEGLLAAFPEVAVKLGGFDEKTLAGATQIVMSPGVSRHTPEIARMAALGIPVIGDVELFVRQVEQPIIAITGSNGKSTVTSLVGEMARACGFRVKVGGNIGTPVLALLEGEAPELYVLELSSFQLETTYSLKARCAVCLNISEDHMDRYDEMADYMAAKLKVYAQAEAAVINCDDPRAYQGATLPSRSLGFSINGVETADFSLIEYEDQHYLAFAGERLLPTAALQLGGTHQFANVLAALAIGTACGFDRAGMLAAATQFAGLAHRCQLVARGGDISWYNDSKATNVGAAIASLCGIGTDISGKILWLAGGEGKGADFSFLRQPVRDFVGAAILFGQDREKIAQALAGVVPVVLVDDLQTAIAKAQALAQPGDAVLLAPACASFDMFNNFEHRGESFVAGVQGVLR